MSISAKNIVSLLVGALLGTVVMWLVWPETADADVQNETANWSRWSDRAIEEKIKDASLEEVKGFVQSEMDMELPADYVIPAHIANARSSGDAVKQVNRDYVVFSSAKGDDFLSAVQQDPLRYRKFLWAHKAVRKRFKKD